MFKLIIKLSVLLCVLIHSPHALSASKYFYDAKQCAKLGVASGERLVEVEEIFQSLLEHAELKGNFYLCPTTAFSAAFALDASKLEKRVSVKGQYIGYDSKFMSSLRNEVDYWSVFAVLAHELAHHKLGHTLDDRGSRPNIEIRADRMAGLLMQKSGASLGNALTLASLAFMQNGGSTHPTGAQRKIAFKGGWLAGCHEKKTPQCPGYKHKKENIVADKSYQETSGFLALRKQANKYKGKAVTDDYCKLYANVSVKQTQRNAQNKCGYLVDKSNRARWSLDLNGQRHWCLSVSAYATEKENLFREKQLKGCLIK